MTELKTLKEKMGLEKNSLGGGFVIDCRDYECNKKEEINPSYRMKHENVRL